MWLYLSLRSTVLFASWASTHIVWWVLLRSGCLLDHETHKLQCIMISTSFHYREKLQLGTAAVRGGFHKDFEGSGQLNTAYFAHHCKEIVNYKVTALKTNTGRWDFQWHFLFNVLTIIWLNFCHWWRHWQQQLIF